MGRAMLPTNAPKSAPQVIPETGRATREEKTRAPKDDAEVVNVGAEAWNARYLPRIERAHHEPTDEKRELGRQQYSAHVCDERIDFLGLARCNNVRPAAWRTAKLRQ